MSEDSGTTVNINCSAGELADSLNGSKDTLEKILTATQRIENALLYTYQVMADMADAVIHIHDAHLHFKSHSPQDGYDVGTGGFLMPPPRGLGDRLAQEFSNNTDLDLNGLIYGRDFIIDVDDVDAPPILLTVFEMIPRKQRLSTKKLSWKSYLATLPGNGVVT